MGARGVRLLEGEAGGPTADRRRPVTAGAGRRAELAAGPSRRRWKARHRHAMLGAAGGRGALGVRWTAMLRCCQTARLQDCKTARRLRTTGTRYSWSTAVRSLGGAGNAARVRLRLRSRCSCGAVAVQLVLLVLVLVLVQLQSQSHTHTHTHRQPRRGHCIAQSGKSSEGQPQQAGRGQSTGEEQRQQWAESNEAQRPPCPGDGLSIKQRRAACAHGR